MARGSSFYHRLCALYGRLLSKLRWLNSELSGYFQARRADLTAARAENLEPRLMMTAYSITGTSGNDPYYLRLNTSGDAEIYQGTSAGGTLVYTLSPSSDSLTINAGDGTNSLIIDGVNGNPIPAGGIAFTGGTGADEVDIISVGDSEDLVPVIQDGGENGPPAYGLAYDGGSGTDTLAVTDSGVTVNSNLYISAMAVNGSSVVAFPSEQSLATLEVSGYGEVTASDALGEGLTVQVNDAATVTFNSSQHLAALEVNDSAQVTATGDLGEDMTTTTVTANDSSAITFDSSQTLSALQINNSAVAELTPDQSYVLTVGSLTFDRTDEGFAGDYYLSGSSGGQIQLYQSGGSYYCSAGVQLRDVLGGLMADGDLEETESGLAIRADLDQTALGLSIRTSLESSLLSRTTSDDLQATPLGRPSPELMEFLLTECYGSPTLVLLGLSTMTISAGDSSTSVTVDGSGGEAMPSSGLTFTGGAGDDTLEIIGEGSSNSPIDNLTFNTGNNGYDQLLISGSNVVLGNDLGPATRDSSATMWAQVGGFSYNDSGTLTFDSTEHLTRLQIAEGSTVVLAAGGGNTLYIPDILGISGYRGYPDHTVDNGDGTFSAYGEASGSYVGTLDINDNALVQGDPYGDLLSYTSSMVISGDAYGTGIISSTAAAHPNEPRAIGVSSVDGHLETRYTYMGDANLDGVVDALDVDRVNTGFKSGYVGWGNGDFNYDGVVHVDDYSLLGEGAIESESPAAVGGAANYYVQVLPDGTTIQVLDDEGPVATLDGAAQAGGLILLAAAGGTHVIIDGTYGNPTAAGLLFVGGTAGDTVEIRNGGDEQYDGLTFIGETGNDVLQIADGQMSFDSNLNAAAESLTLELSGTSTVTVTNPIQDLTLNAPATGSIDYVLAADTLAVKTVGGTAVSYYLRAAETTGDMELRTNPSSSSPMATLDLPAPFGLTITGGAGADNLTIDGTYGDPLPAGGLVFNGGAGNDTVNIINAGGLSLEGLTFDGGTGQDALQIDSGQITFDDDLGATTENLTLKLFQQSAVVFNSSQHLAGLEVDCVSTVTANGYLLSVGALTIDRAYDTAADFYLLASGSTIELFQNGTPANYDPPTYILSKTALSTLSLGASDQGNTLTIDGSGGVPIPSGGLVYDAKNAATGQDTVNVINGGSLSLGKLTFERGHGDKTLNINSGHLTLNCVSSTLSGVTVAVGSAGVVTFDTSQNLSELDVAAGGSVVLAVGGQATLAVDDLELAHQSGGETYPTGATTYTGTIDINDNSFSYGTANALATMVASGIAHGTGIISSTAAADPNAAHGIAVSGNVACYALLGDTNLNGQITATDYNAMHAGTTSGSTGWANGDFNYDGVVNSSDYAEVLVPQVAAGHTGVLFGAAGYVLRANSDGSVIQVFKIGSPTNTLLCTLSASWLGSVTIEAVATGTHVTVDGAFGNPVPAGGLVFAGGAGDDTVEIVNGGGVSYNGLTFSGGGGNDTLSLSDAHLAVNSNLGGAGESMTVEANEASVLTFNSSQHLAALAINDSSVVSLAAGGDKVLAIGAGTGTGGLSIAGSGGAFTGQLDLNDNALIVNYGTGTGNGEDALTIVSGMIASGLAGTTSYWDGAGIASSTAAAADDPLATYEPPRAIGVIDNALPDSEQVYATFAGESVSANAILVRYTWWGDADLDGQITAADNLLYTYGAGNNGDSWMYGDFDYSGTADYSTDCCLLGYGNAGANNRGSLDLAVVGPTSAYTGAVQGFSVNAGTSGLWTYAWSVTFNDDPLTPPGVATDQPTFEFRPTEEGYYDISVQIGLKSDDLTPDPASTGLSIYDLSTLTGTSGNDSYVIKKIDGDIAIFVNTPSTGTPTYRFPGWGESSSLAILGDGGNDTLTVDASDGDPLPTGGLTFTGGSGDDTVNLIGCDSTATAKVILGFGGGNDTLNLTDSELSVASDLGGAPGELIGVTADGDSVLTFTSGQHLTSLAISGGASVTTGSYVMTVGTFSIDRSTQASAFDYGFQVSSQAGRVELSENATSGPTYILSQSDLTRLTITGADAGNSLTIDGANGNPIPSGGLAFTGGAGDDTVEIAHGGNRSYSGLTFTGSAGDDTLQITDGHMAFDADVNQATENLALILLGSSMASFDSSQHLASLEVNDTSVAYVPPGHAYVLMVGAMTIDRSGDASAPEYYLRRSASGDQVELFEDAASVTGPPTYVLSRADLSNLSLSGGNVASTLTIDGVNGDAIPSGGLTFTGGSGDDTVNLIGCDSTATAKVILGFGGGNDTLNLTDSELSVASDLGGATGELIGVTADGDSVLTFTSGQHLTSLAISGGASVTAGSYVMTVGTFSIDRSTQASAFDYGFQVSSQAGRVELSENATSGPTYILSQSDLTRLTITGADAGNSLTIDGANGNPIPSGGLAFTGGAGDDTVELAGLGSSYASIQAPTFNAGGGDDNLIVSGSYVFVDKDLGGGGASMAVQVGDGAALTFTASQHLATLVIDYPGTVVLAQGGNKVLFIGPGTAGTGGLSIASSSNLFAAQLDINDNALIVNYASGNGAAALAAVTAMIASGLNDGGDLWSGLGLASGTAAGLVSGGDWTRGIGVIDNNDDGDPSYATFMGQTVGLDAVLVRYTFRGDTNLDARIDNVDRAQVEAGLTASGVGWYNGDSDYDGQVAQGELDLLDGVYYGSAAPPSDVTVTVVSATEIDLSWTSASGNETGFTIERATVDGTTTSPFAPLDTVAGNVTNYRDLAVSVGLQYIYRLFAMNANASGLSTPTSGYTDATTPTAPANTSVPKAPSDLKATMVPGDGPLPVEPDGTPSQGWSYSICLTWTNNSIDATSFEVQRATSPQGGWQTIYTPSHYWTNVYDGDSVLFTTASSSTTYYYRVGASNGVGDYVFSDAVTSAPYAPTPPSDPDDDPPATSDDDSSIDLHWVDNSGNEDHFEVQRATKAAFSDAEMLDPADANATDYHDADLTPSTTYYYRVWATNVAGDSRYISFTALTRPAAPTAEALSLSSGDVYLSWPEQPEDVNQMVVIATGDGEPQTWEVQKRWGSLPPGFTIPRAATGQARNFQVFARNNSGDSEGSNILSDVATLAEPPWSPHPASAAFAFEDTTTEGDWTENLGIVDGDDVYPVEEIWIPGGQPSDFTRPWPSGEPYGLSSTGGHIFGQGAMMVGWGVLPQSPSAAPGALASPWMLSGLQLSSNSLNSEESPLEFAFDNYSPEEQYPATHYVGIYIVGGPADFTVYNYYNPTQALGASHHVAAAPNGVYVVWEVSGSVIIRPTDRVNGYMLFYGAFVLGSPLEENQAAPTVAPIALAAGSGMGRVDIAWDATSPLLKGDKFNIYRRIPQDGQDEEDGWTCVESNWRYSYYEDLGDEEHPLYPGTTYEYRVSAVNSGGEGPNSEVRSVSTRGGVEAVGEVTIDAEHTVRYFGDQDPGIYMLEYESGAFLATVDYTRTLFTRGGLTLLSGDATPPASLDLPLQASWPVSPSCYTLDGATFATDYTLLSADIREGSGPTDSAFVHEGGVIGLQFTDTDNNILSPLVYKLFRVTTLDIAVDGDNNDPHGVPDGSDVEQDDSENAVPDGEGGWEDSPVNAADDSQNAMHEGKGMLVASGTNIPLWLETGQPLNFFVPSFGTSDDSWSVNFKLVYPSDLELGEDSGEAFSAPTSAMYSMPLGASADAGVTSIIRLQYGTPQENATFHDVNKIMVTTIGSHANTASQGVPTVEGKLFFTDIDAVGSSIYRTSTADGRTLEFTAGSELLFLGGSFAVQEGNGTRIYETCHTDGSGVACRGAGQYSLRVVVGDSDGDYEGDYVETGPDGLQTFFSKDTGKVVKIVIAEGNETVFSYEDADSAHPNKKNMRLTKATRTVNGVTWETTLDYDGGSTVHYMVVESGSTVVSKAGYDYTNGDLTKVTSYAGSSNILETKCYVYYQSDSATGFAHGLKYYFSGPTVARMSGASLDPLTAADAVCQQYADDYYEYQKDDAAYDARNPGNTDNPFKPDPNDDSKSWVAPEYRVSKWVTQGTGDATANGRNISTFKYERESDDTADGYNNVRWTRKESRPNDPLIAEDGIVTKANFAGQVLSVEVTPAGGSAVTVAAYTYGESDTGIGLLASSTLSGGYSDSYTYSPGGHIASATAMGATTENAYAAGIIHATSFGVFEFAGGTKDDVGSGDTRDTTYAYLWYPDSNQVKMIQATQEAVPAAENGSGAATVTATAYDKYGRGIWTKDANGILNYTAYRDDTGAVSMTIADADLNSPDFISMTRHFVEELGWSALPGEHKHLKTEYESDAFGRIIQVTDANGVITRMVYTDTDDGKSHEVRTFTADDSGNAIGAISVTRDDWAHGYSDTLVFSAIGTNGEGAISNVQSLSRRLYNEGGRLVATRDYSSLTGTSYSTTTADFGSAGTNYLETTYDYDSNGRLVRTKTPDGVITRTVYDYLGRAESLWQGTHDTPSQGDWSPSNLTGTDMVKLSENVFNTAGLLSESRTYVAASGTGSCLSTFYGYDSNSRQTDVLGPGGVGTHYDLNDLGEVTFVKTYSGASLSAGHVVGTLEAQTETKYDQRGQVYQTVVYNVSNSETQVTNASYGADGAQKKVVGPNGFAATTYDTAGRVANSSGGYLIGSVAKPVVMTKPGYAVNKDRVDVLKTGSNSTNVVATTKYAYDDTTGLVTGVGTPLPKAGMGDPAGKKGTDLSFTLCGYDSAGRQNVTISPDPDVAGLHATLVETDYDMLGRVTTTKTYATTIGQSGNTSILATPTNTWSDTAKGTLLSQSENHYNDKGQLEDTRVYAIALVGGVMAATHYLQTNYAYDALGRLVTTTQPSGAFSKTAYNAYGRVTDAYVGTYDGSSANDPADVSSDIIASQTHYDYDTAGRLYLTTNRVRLAGNTTVGDLAGGSAQVTLVQTVFDGLGRADTVTTSGSAVSMTTTYGYDGFGRQNTVMDNAEHTTRTFFDEKGRKEYVVENCTEDFDPLDEDLYSVGPGHAQNRVTQYVYNAAGLVTQQIAYNPVWNGDDMVSLNPQTTRYIYLMDLSPMAKLAFSAVADSTLLVATAYADSTTSDVIGALNTGQSGDFVWQTYNADGSVATLTDQRGVKHEYVYDNLGRQTSDTVTSLGSSGQVDNSVLRIDHAYDDYGRLVLLTSYSNTAGGSGNIVSQEAWQYDAWGNVEYAWQAHGGAAVTAGGNQSPRVHYTYAEDAAGSASTFVRLDSVTYPDGRVVKYSYGVASGGNASDAARIDYAAGRVYQITSADTTPVVYVQYGYLGDGTIAGESHPAAGGDGTVLRLEITGGSGGFGIGNTVYEWDSTGETLGDGEGTVLDATESWVWIQVTAGGWDADGIVSTDSGSFSSGVTYSTVTAAGGLDLALSFDGLERVTGVDWSSAGRTLDHYDYQYDASGNRTVRGNPERSTSASTYTFDALNRVTADNRFSGQNQSWNLDVQGNMLTVWADANHDGVVDENESPQTRTYTAGNRIDMVTEGETTWHAGYDSAGNMTFDGTNHFVYDAWNQLVGVKADVVNGSTHTAGAVIATYQYDGRGWRTAKLVAQYSGGTLTGYARTEFYYNEGWQVVEERMGTVSSTTTVVSSTAGRVQYVWDQSYIDTPVCRFRGGAGSTWETLYYTADANHNVVGLVDGASGLPVEQYYYDAYGKVTVCEPNPVIYQNWPPREDNQSDYGNEVMFAGGMNNPESNLNLNRWNYLDIALSVWTGPDRAHTTTNDYGYVGNNPIGRTDPSGLDPEADILAELNENNAKYDTWDKRRTIVVVKYETSGTVHYGMHYGFKDSEGTATFGYRPLIDSWAHACYESTAPAGPTDSQLVQAWWRAKGAGQPPVPGFDAKLIVDIYSGKVTAIPGYPSFNEMAAGGSEAAGRLLQFQKGALSYSRWELVACLGAAMAEARALGLGTGKAGAAAAQGAVKETLATSESAAEALGAESRVVLPPMDMGPGTRAMSVARSDVVSLAEATGLPASSPSRFLPGDYLPGMGAYRDVLGHHPLSGRVFNYDYYYDAMAIGSDQLAAFNVGHPQPLSTLQMLEYKAFGKTGESLTLTRMTGIEVEAMIQAGVPQEYARQAASLAFWERLSNQQYTPVRIPWVGPNPGMVKP